MLSTCSVQISSSSILGRCWWEGLALRNLECRPGSGRDLLKSVPMLSGLGNYQFIPREGFQGPQGSQHWCQAGAEGAGPGCQSRLGSAMSCWCWPLIGQLLTIPRLWLADADTMSRLSGLGSQVVINKLQPCSAGQLVWSQSTEDKTPWKLIRMECWGILWITCDGLDGGGPYTYSIIVETVHIWDFSFRDYFVLSN